MSEPKFFFDKSKMTQLWPQAGVSLVVRSKDVEMDASEVSFTFGSGAKELSLRSE